MSLFRISLVGCCLVALSALPSLVAAQQNFSYPTTVQPEFTGFSSSGEGGFGVSSPAFADTQLPGFADHSSMSPDSWSAPPTGPVVMPQLAPQQQTRVAENSSVQVSPDKLPTRSPESQFIRTSDSRFQPGIPTNNSWPSGESQPVAEATPPNSGVADGAESVLFQGKRPELLKFDSRDALSTSEQAKPELKADTPTVPELNTDSPFRLAKATLPKAAAKQSSLGAVSNPTKSNVVSLIAPLQGTTGQSFPVPNSNMPNQNFLSGQGVTHQAPVYGMETQPQSQYLNPPAHTPFAGQVLPQNSMPTEQSTLGYPTRYPMTQNTATFSPPTRYPLTQEAGMFNPGMQAPMMQNPMMQSGPNFRPDLGFRSPMPTTRHAGSYDNGKKFEFEDKKKEYPPMSEILATGRYFGSLAARFVRPHSQNNTAFTTTSATFVEGVAFDYDYDFSPFVRFGFESKYGPGIEFDYFKFNGKSNQAQFTSNGAVTAQVQTLGPGASQFGAFNAGESLDAQHTLSFETFGVSFFKEVKLPISRVNGRFGFQYTSIAHNLDASLADATGELGVFNSRSDFRGIGPKFTLEYYRPVGHTPLEFITAISGGVTYGRRDQFVENSLGNGFSRAGADEFLTNLEFNTGIQYKHNLAENRSVFARLGTTYSTWLGGGSAIDPQSDFGLRGFSFTVGYNR